MRLRRLDDKAPGVLLATPSGWIGDGSRPRWADVLATRPGHDGKSARTLDDGLVLLMEEGADEAVLVAPSRTCRITRGDADELLWQAAARARQERLRLEKRQRLPDQLIAYFEELNAADAADDVFRALAAHALVVVGAHTAVAFARDGARGLLRAPARREATAGEFRPCIAWDARFAEPGLVLAVDARCDGAFPALAPLFGDPQTALAAHVPVGDDGVLVLTERREDRIFEPEDWDVLRALTLQAGMALKRIRLIESVRSLSLTDSLTGLANRRHMEVVLEHAWAAARRGEPLTVIVMDLDGFKEVNDREGHLAGDRLLCEVACALRAEARGSDVVVRYGGDEFLAILPGGDGAAARALVARVRRRLGGRVGLSDGVAEYHAACPSPAELIREADRALYDAKRDRGDTQPEFPRLDLSIRPFPEKKAN
jgi:diguanylate cyclase (GGDEF)-like protein